MNSAILVAAGKGTRMGPGVDKLFLEVAGRPIAAALTALRVPRSRAAGGSEGVLPASP